MDWPQYVISLLAALGGGATVREIVGAVGRARSGKMKVERIEAKTLVDRARRAEAMAEWQINWRIAMMDHAAACRSIAIEFGAEPSELPPWPQPPEPRPGIREGPDTSTV